MTRHNEFPFGPIGTPPKPGGVAMVDRSNGNSYYVSESSAALVMTLVPSNWTYFVYGANHGPIMLTPDGPIRLFVSGGALDYDNYDGGVRDAPIMTLWLGTTRVIYELTAPASFKRGDAASTFTLVQQ